MTGEQIPLPSRRDALFALAGSLPLVLAAQTGGFPQKPVRIVVPYPTGGSNDVIARLLAQQLQEQWGQAVVVDNKPGAAGNIGAAEVAKAAALERLKSMDAELRSAVHERDAVALDAQRAIEAAMAEKKWAVDVAVAEKQRAVDTAAVEVAPAVAAPILAALAAE